MAKSANPQKAQEETMETKTIVRKLLVKIEELSRNDRALSNLGWNEDNPYQQASDALEDAVLEILGIPEDDYRTIDYSTGEGEGFSRDWWYDVLFDMGEGNITVDKALEMLTEEWTYEPEESER